MRQPDSRDARIGGRLVRIACVAGAMLIGILGVTVPVLGAAAAPAEVARGVYFVRGERGEINPANLGHVANVAFIIGPRGVVVLDSGASYRQGEEIIASIKRVTRQPIRLLIITHPSQEVVFGAAAFQAHSVPVLMHRSSAALMTSRCDTCLKTLTETLGDQAMAGSRVADPDRLISRTQSIDVIGRRLGLIVPKHGSAPGALAVWDETTGTLITGSLVSIERIPDLRDADGKGWTQALAELAATHCTHLIPAYGRIGSCADIDPLKRYFVALDRRVRELLAEGVGLAEVRTRCDLPEFAAWDGYDTLHVQNANRAYLRLERAAFKE
jgi:glyoxylase-like metal-dependent hydrolase (beta-lactamase superfamily II)